jgi:thioester reductase-like protein
VGEHLFLTGGTGFIGSRLARAWLRRTAARITLLVRPHGRSRDPLRGTAPLGGDDDDRTRLAERVEFVTGDLGAPALGLAPEDAALLAESVTHIVHAGADLRFNLPLDRARRVNTGGTAAVLEFARRCPHLAAFQYLGTAYVAGRRRGVVREEGANGATGHHNSYERSKYEAEKLVEGAMADIPAAVLRPTIVTCDLADGFCPDTSAFFRLLAGIASGLLTVLPGRSDTLLDMVPVDFVVEAAFAIGRRSDAAGRYFHLGAGEENLISLGDLTALACRTFGREPVRIVSGPEFQDWAEGVRRRVPAAGRLLAEVALYAPYLAGHARFDDRNTRGAMNGASLPPRAIVEYFDRIAAFVGERTTRS